uniref:Acetyltransferase n=2 Tax=unclassified Caudoviricetes TaxID=2788787 RepID=A0A8S5Q864_9CAUD|nr:MAG TPA: hypothetical protein [Siphoviridae sp. ctAvK3]DAE15122.1 MAG TPA: hypothetical protein [Siphoviridae sp. ctdVv30]
MIECHDSEPLKHFYLSNGFKIMCSDQEKGKTMVQMICRIPDGRAG